ncbi:MAG: cytochrome P450 [Ignavibacteria bacterium]|nr:cytochrome P450 [Ignavibacteria bacterium]
MKIDQSFDLFKTLLSKETIDNPYPIYKILRDQSPVYFVESPSGFLSENIWVLTRYDDISKVLINKKFGRGNRFGKVKVNSKFYEKMNSLTKMRQHWVNFLDPPDHTRIRGFINKCFTPGMVNNSRERMESIADHLISKFSGGKAEIISEFSYQFATLVIAEFLGTPESDRDILDKWASQLVKTLDVVTNQFSQEDLTVIYKAADEMKLYMSDIVKRKEKNPGDDFISRMLAISENDDKPDHEEIIATPVLLIMDAHEAPKNLISNGLYALLRNPEQHKMLLEDMSLLDNAVEEMLRYDSPAQFTGRRTHEDEIIRGFEIKKGVQLICMLGAGNRDPERYENPDKFDIRRKNIMPLSFGGGIHFCAGAGMAKVEAQAAFSRLLNAFPNMSLTGNDYHYHNYLHSRGLDSLNVKL